MIPPGEGGIADRPLLPGLDPAGYCRVPVNIVPWSLIPPGEGGIADRPPLPGLDPAG